MREIIAHYMVLLYFTVMIKPVIPITADFLSHTFSEAIHISTVHALYGSNHVQKEMSREARDANHPNSLSNEDAFVHIPSVAILYSFELYTTPLSYPINKANALMSSSLSKTGPPPKFS